MERQSMFMDRKTQYCQSVNSSQIDLYIQCSCNQILASCFMDVDKPVLKFMWRSKRLRIVNTILKENN